MQIKLIKGDITKIEVDAIVNAANSTLLGGGGLDGAIHKNGGPTILEACKEIRSRQGGCPTGEAVITTAGNLPAKKVIHTVGPLWKGGNHDEDQLLANCYINALLLADVFALKTIAFPNISTGVYHFPKERAARIALEAVNTYKVEHVDSCIEKILFVCFDELNYRIYARLLKD